MPDNEMKFEEALAKLESIVKQLEEGGLPLNKSLQIFTEGIKLVKFCNNELNIAEKKIEIVVNEEDEYLDIVPFEQEEELN